MYKRQFYTFWCDEYTLSLIKHKYKNHKYKVVSRLHGRDLYNERYAFGRQPFKNIINPVSYTHLDVYKRQALFFRAREGMLSKGNCLILLILAVILGCVKGGFYLLVLLPFMCISARNYGSSKRKWFISLGSIAVGTLAMIFTSFKAYWSMLQKMLGVSNGITKSLVNTAPVIAEAVEKIPETDVPAYGISFLFTDLFGFIELFIRTLVHKADFYLGGLLGYRMAWTDETINWVILIPVSYTHLDVYKRQLLYLLLFQ